MDERVNKNNDPSGAMDRKEEVHSNDRKMKQDFPGYPHNPSSEDVMKENKNWKTDFSNESDTTATGSESVRSERPSEKQNETQEDDFRVGNDRGMVVHEEDPGDVENSNARS